MNLKGYFGVQTAKGQVKTTNLIQANITDWNLNEEIGKTDSRVIGVGRFVADGFVSSKRVSGDVPLEPTLLEIATLLQGAGYKGTKDTGGKITTFKATDGFEKYLTFALSYLEHDMKEITSDCLVNDIKFGLEKESYIDFSVSVLGMTHTKTSGKLTTTPVQNQGKRLTCLGIILKKNNIDITAQIESADLTLSNGLEATGSINSVRTKTIRQGSRGEVKVSLNYNGFDKEEYLRADQLLTSDGATTLEITLGEDVEQNLVERETAKKLVIELPVVKYSNNENGDKAGLGTLTQELSAYPNEEGQPIIFKFHNLQEGAI